MASGLTIKIVDPDADYLGIEIHASNDRFAGSTRIYAGLEELSEFANQIAGFPVSVHDGGYVSLVLLSRLAPPGNVSDCVSTTSTGRRHAAVEIALEDDGRRYTWGTAELSFRIEAAAIDRFTKSLREVEHARSGEAVLCSAD